MIEKITDVNVKIDIMHPQPIVGLGNPAIFLFKDLLKTIKNIQV